MPNYVAFLGHQPAISLAELSVMFPGFNLKSQMTKTAALFFVNDPLDQSDLDRLGGTVILAEEREICPYNPKDPGGLPDRLRRIPALLSGELNVRKRGKVIFGLRTEGLDRSLIKALYRAGKLTLKRQGRPCRYVGNERKPAATALLHGARLIAHKDGCELVVIVGEKFVWIGRTIAAQNVSAYAHRDMEKPVRDTRTGLLPPKLAQILLNLGAWIATSPTNANEQKSKIQKHFTMYDPFCGTGVIPMEAMLKGWNVLASDISQKAVNATKKNIDWLRKEYKIFKKDVGSRVWKQDATRQLKFEKNETIDVIVTETTLGPPLERPPSQKDVKKWCSENEKLQQKFLINVATSLPHIPIICTWPIWYTKTGPVFLEKVWKTVTEHGFRPVLPPFLPSISKPSFVYRRPDQFVGREIVLLKPLV